MDFLIVLEARRPRLARKTCIGCTGWGCSSWRCQLNSHMSFPLSMVGWGMEMARDGEGGLPGVSSYHLNTNPVDWVSNKNIVIQSYIIFMNFLT